MNSPCFASAPYIFHPVSESSATESDDSTDSGQEKIVGGTRTKYNDPKHRTINKVSKKILKAIERLTCNLKKKTKKYKALSENVKVDTPSNKSVATKPPLKSPSAPVAPCSLPKRE
ncbi:hypothetical protein RR48_12402 [Papilio machaon]|uniref:Uncharacterized protein n=1 Tax=Papilio machaon TaxID=76193 RepID=A0A194RS46_PAPMA|nr:hypothetical protein RR48_12402 [Papilio machaon]